MMNYFNNLNLIALFWKWRKQILIVTLVAGVAAVVITMPFIIKPLYSSSAIVYPANLKAFSNESNTEQMMQFLESSDIRDSIVRKFDLYRHYNINPAGKKAYYHVSIAYSEAVTISKKNYESVEIRVSDINPDTACHMVNAIIYFFNKKVRAVQDEKFKEIYVQNQAMVHLKINEIDSLNNLLKGMHTKNQLIDFDTQTTEMIRGYLRTIDGASRTSVNTPEILRLKKELEEKGTDFLIIDNQFRQAIEQLGKLKEAQDLAFKDYKRDFSFVNSITAPVPAEKNYYPIRWLIVLSTMLATMITAMIVIVIIDNRKRLSELVTSLAK
jgi:capsular polysaccharide biosynthesis protein